MRQEFTIPATWVVAILGNIVDLILVSFSSKSEVYCSQSHDHVRLGIKDQKCSHLVKFWANGSRTFNHVKKSYFQPNFALSCSALNTKLTKLE